ncbi:MAG: TonB-dependent receptor, partial [Gammaproteobacteria bacterium]|nr:TonB-dependent receptor [Gammaproteobacteria bacterium]
MMTRLISGRRLAATFRTLLAPLAIAALTASGSAVSAAPLEEIVVTATKRDESLQEVPAAITAFTTSDIERNRITRPADFIELTPGVVLSDSNHPGEALITIRGTAQTRNTETPVAVVVDGVLLTGRTAFNGELFDISQIEVLKGPQGYLYGRNAIGGAIVIQTRRPENEWQRSVTVGYGNYNHARARFSAGGALIEDELFLQFSGSVRDRDGFYQNITRGEDMDPLTEKVGRARLIWEPKGTNFTADFRISATDVDASSTNFRPQTEFAALQSNPASSILDINRVEEIPFVRNVESTAKQEKQSYALKLDYDAAFGSFTSVTTYDNTLDVF